MSDGPVDQIMSNKCCLVCSKKALRQWCDDSNRAARAFICVFIVTCTVASALVICGCLVVKPYLMSRDYQPTECRTLNVTFWQQWCCLRILVRFRDLNNERHLAYIIEDEYSLLDGHHAACTYVSCVNSKVAAYAGDWEDIGQPLSCFYNPRDYKQVIRRKRFTQATLLHSVLWPSVLIAIGVVAMLLLRRMAKLNFGGKTDSFYITPTPVDSQLTERELSIRLRDVVTVTSQSPASNSQ